MSSRQDASRKVILDTKVFIFSPKKRACVQFQNVCSTSLVLPEWFGVWFKLIIDWLFGKSLTSHLCRQHLQSWHLTVVWDSNLSIFHPSFEQRNYYLRSTYQPMPLLIYFYRILEKIYDREPEWQQDSWIVSVGEGIIFKCNYYRVVVEKNSQNWVLNSLHYFRFSSLEGFLGLVLLWRNQAN